MARPRDLDISVPSDPVEVGAFSSWGWTVDVAVAGNHAYVAENYVSHYPWYVDNGLRVVDVSSPSAPTEVGFFEMPRSPSGVDVSGGYAYVANGIAGMAVIGDCHLIFVDCFESGDTSVWK